jgi:hypothetical protein
VIEAADVTGDRATLASIVGDVDGFLTNCFGRSPWIGWTEALSGRFGVDEFDTIVSSAVRAPAIRLVREGARIPPSEFCSPTRIGNSTLTDTADARKVLDQHRRGATVVLQSLQRTWPPLISWCCALEADLGWPVQANAYLTPPHQRGLGRHADGHDVFVVQLHGQKRWDVEGVGERWRAPGDVMYLPASTPHVADTGDQPSLHLTVGVHRPTGAKIARAALELAEGRAGAERPAGVEDGDEERLRLVVGELAGIGAAQALDRLRRPPRVPAAGLLAASVRRPALDRTSRVRSSAAWHLDQSEDAALLSWDGQCLRLPARAAAALAQIASLHGRSVAVGELTGLEADEGLVVARRLLDEGALVLDGD